MIVHALRAILRDLASLSVKEVKIVQDVLIFIMLYLILNKTEHVLNMLSELLKLFK